VAERGCGWGWWWWWCPTTPAAGVVGVVCWHRPGAPAAAGVVGVGIGVVGVVCGHLQLQAGIA